MKNRYHIFLIVLFSILCLDFNASAQPVLFNHTYGSGQYNQGRRIIEAGDRGFFILGNVSANSGNSNIHIIRTDSLGIISYEKNLGDGSIYWANDFIRTADHGFLICGLTDKLPEKGYDMLLIKTDSNINVEWERQYGGADWDIANAVIETKDSAYLMAGLTYSYGAPNENIYIVKTNYLGDTIWTKTFGGDSSDYATSVDVCFDSTYLIGATTNSFGFGNFDGYVLNLDLNGDTIWTKNYGEEKEDIIYSIKQTPDSGFVFVGSTTSYNSIEHETWLMKFDKDRNYIWRLPEFWDVLSGDQVAYNVNLTDSAHFLISGYSTFVDGSKDLSMIIMRDNVNFKCSLTSGSSSDEVGYQSIQTADKGYAIVGYSEDLGIGMTNIFVVKIGNDCSYSTINEHITDVDDTPYSHEKNNFEIIPNISCGEYLITFKENTGSEKYAIKVFNVFGEEVFSENPGMHQNHYKIDLSNVADGMYILMISSAKNNGSFKIIKHSR
ncbi:MAG TPA: T9SS type A sorting domain-containing protein [Bacteroidales bacterium]|nr:T9SS type A sorting domain-containing protein [Bacteroidales bacterium]